MIDAKDRSASTQALAWDQAIAPQAARRRRGLGVPLPRGELARGTFAERCDVDVAPKSTKLKPDLLPPTTPTATAVTQLNPPVPTDCQRCGVCCFSPSPEYVWVTGYDWTRLGNEADRLAHFIGNRAFMKMHAGHCVALEISRRAGGETAYSCSIYERRPEICRALERGSPECLGELETKSEQVRQQAIG